VYASSPVGIENGQIDTRDLFALLDGLPDPRKTGWRRHPLGYVLAVTFSAFMVPGFESLEAVAQWAAARTRAQLLRLGAWPHPLDGQVWPPSEKTIRWLLTELDPQALVAACVAWTLAHRHRPEADPGRDGQVMDGQVMAARLTALAMDGKSARGAKSADGSMPHFVSAVTHAESVVVAQTQVPHKTSEIDAVATLLTDLGRSGWDLSTTVITLDALHTVAATATAITATGAHYVMTVKANRKRLQAACAAAFARADTDPDRDVRHDVQTSRGHGRTEERHLAAVAIEPGDDIDFPGAAQIIRVVRYRGGLDGQRTSKEVVFVITSLTPDQADVHDLARYVREHWHIENGVHYRRDISFGEDRSHARTGNLPAVLACVRNTIIAALLLAGATAIPRARRWASQAPERIIDLFTADTNPDIASL
jgi:predicted transposase YbfD/YdcC